MPTELPNLPFCAQSHQNGSCPCPKSSASQAGHPSAYDWSVLLNRVLSKYLIHFTGCPCQEDSLHLPCNAPAPPHNTAHNWYPFEGKTSFEWCHLEFVCKRLSYNKLNEALRIWSESGKEQHDDDWAPSASANNMYSTIDKIPYGAYSWSLFELCYTGEDAHHANAPSWKRAAYTVYTCDAHETLLAQVGSSDFKGHFNVAPYRKFEKQKNGKWERKYPHVMSGQWAWDAAVSQTILNVNMSLYCL